MLTVQHVEQRVLGIVGNNDDMAGIADCLFQHLPDQCLSTLHRILSSI